MCSSDLCSNVPDLILRQQRAREAGKVRVGVGPDVVEQPVPRRNRRSRIGHREGRTQQTRPSAVTSLLLVVVACSRWRDEAVAAVLEGIARETGVGSRLIPGFSSSSRRHGVVSRRRGTERRRVRAGHVGSRRGRTDDVRLLSRRLPANLIARLSQQARHESLKVEGALRVQAGGSKVVRSFFNQT